MVAVTGQVVKHRPAPGPWWCAGCRLQRSDKCERTADDRAECYDQMSADAALQEAERRRN